MWVLVMATFMMLSIYDSLTTTGTGETLPQFSDILGEITRYEKVN